MADHGRLVIDKYCRISESYDGTTRSVDDQDALGTYTIEQRGHIVGATFKDPFKSGWRKDVRRANFDACVARAVAGTSNGIWVYDLTRFTRKPHEGEPLLNLADRGFIIISEDGEYDLSRAEGRKRYRDALAQAAYESDKISERSRLGKRRKAHVRGLSNAGRRGFGESGYAPRPEGWVRDGSPPELVSEDVVRAEREALRFIANGLLARTMSTYDAARYLNDEGLLTPLGNQWKPTLVTQTFRRPSLAGYVVYDGQIVDGRRLPGEPVLDEDTWHRLRSMFRARKRGRVANRYILSGSMLCECGKPLSARPVTRVKAYADGEPAREYLCLYYPGVGGCYRNSIDQRYADSIVGQMTVERLSDSRHSDRLAASEAASSDERGKIVAEIDSEERRLVDLAGKGGELRWSIEEVEAYAGPIRKRIAALKSALDELLSNSEPEPTPALDAERRWVAAGGPLPNRPYPHFDEMNIEVLRGMVREAFPNLTLRRGARTSGRVECHAGRFLWEG